MGQIICLTLLVGGSILINVAMSSPAAAQSFAVDHPVMDFGDDRERLERRVRAIDGATEEELLERLEARGRRRRSGRRGYRSAVEAAIGLWKLTDEPSYRDLATRACRVALGGILEASDGELRAQITEVGPQDEANVRRRDACY
ncbi:MAG: hypothetical protein QGI83_20740, partial [Candidatus Latescibacteria bacterium]|nr:hypothetical protein [Candidatus Latescibacterota bacterium]